MTYVFANEMEIVEVGPRDCHQVIEPFIPTATKVAFLQRLVAAGVRRIEIGSFVSKFAVPQLSDTAEIVGIAKEIPGLVPQVLVPNEKYGMIALRAGATFLSFVISVSDAHSLSNVRLTALKSAEQYARLVGEMPAGTRIRLNLATAFDCPFNGVVSEERVLTLLDFLVPLLPEAEICLCDTTGRASPLQVAALFDACIRRFPTVRRWAMHAHDTYGLGLANVFSAWQQGVRIFDASFAGLGGCPFAPGATGNIATEDLIWMLKRMGIELPVDVEALVDIAQDAAAIPGGMPGGRVRQALIARRFIAA